MLPHDPDRIRHDVVRPIDEDVRARLVAGLFEPPQAGEGTRTERHVCAVMPAQLDDDASNAIVRDLMLWGQVPALEVARAAVRVLDVEYEGQDAYVEGIQDEPEAEGDFAEVLARTPDDACVNVISDLPPAVSMHFRIVGERSMLRAVVRRIVADPDRVRGA